MPIQIMKRYICDFCEAYQDVPCNDPNSDATFCSVQIENLISKETHTKYLCRRCTTAVQYWAACNLDDAKDVVTYARDKKKRDKRKQKDI